MSKKTNAEKQRRRVRVARRGTHKRGGKRPNPAAGLTGFDASSLFPTGLTRMLHGMLEMLIGAVEAGYIPEPKPLNPDDAATLVKPESIQ